MLPQQPKGLPQSAIVEALEQESQDARWLPQLDLWIEQAVGVACLLAIGVLILWLTRSLRKLVIVRIIRRTKNTLDDIFVDKAFFHWISYLPPTLIMSAIAEQMPGLGGEHENADTIVTVVRNLLHAVTTLTGMLAVGALIDAGHEIYRRRSAPSRYRPIKGYVGLLKIFLYVLGVVAAVAFRVRPRPDGLARRYRCDDRRALAGVQGHDPVGRGVNHAAAERHDPTRRLGRSARRGRTATSSTWRCTRSRSRTGTARSRRSRPFASSPSRSRTGAT